jgi:hypothetical protein
VKHDGDIRVKMLRRRTILQGTAPADRNCRFELKFERGAERRLSCRSRTRIGMCVLCNNFDDMHTGDGVEAESRSDVAVKRIS